MFSGSLILAAMRVFAPLYFKPTIPLLFDVYWAYGNKNTLAMALSLRLYTVLVVLMLLACLLFRKRLRDPATSVALLAASVAASFAYDIQQTESRYHRYPFWALLVLALAYLSTDLVHSLFEKLSSDLRLVRRMLLVACGVIAVPLCVVAINPALLTKRVTRSQKAADSHGDVLDQFFAKYKPSTTVYVFATSVGPFASAYNHDLNWGGRFSNLWMMPAIIQNELGPTGPPAPFKRLSEEKLATLAALQRTEATEDLTYWKPSVVLVERCSISQPCQGIEGKNFNMLPWFLKSPEFEAVWSHYRQQPGLDDFDVYELVP